MQLLVAGDLLLQYPCSAYDEPRLLALRALVRAADVAMAISRW